MVSSLRGSGIDLAGTAWGAAAGSADVAGAVYSAGSGAKGDEFDCGAISCASATGWAPGVAATMRGAVWVAVSGDSCSFSLRAASDSGCEPAAPGAAVDGVAASAAALAAFARAERFPSIQPRNKAKPVHTSSIAAS